MTKASEFVGGQIVRPVHGWMLHHCLLSLILLAGLCLPLEAQIIGEGTISGTVSDQWRGTPLPGTVVTVRGTTLAATTDATGRYTLEKAPVGEIIVSFSKSGYARATVTEVRVGVGLTSTVDIHLRPEFYEMEEFEVTAEELATQEGTLLIERQQATGIAESIGADRFSRLAAGDAAEIMTKITGVSVVEGKFAVIRGLSERYNIALLNGGDIPSSDPYRKSAQLDLFPSEVIESVTVNKTFTPDLPGSFSGGAMNIVTKSFPEKLVFKVSSGVGYNTQSTFNDDFLTYPGGSLDAFAMDDGTRALPAELRNVSGAQLQALVNTASSGSLAIPVATKTAAAEQIDAYIRAFGSPYMGSTQEAPPADHDFSVLFGQTVELGKRPLGIYAGVSYERDYRFYDGGIRRRYSPVTAGELPETTADFEDARSVKVATWSSLVNLGYKPFEGHELNFNFLYVQNSEDQARQQVGQTFDQLNRNEQTHLNTLHWTERNLTSFQLLGEHDIPAARNLHVDWLAGLANTSQNEPDLRYFNIISSPDSANPTSPERVLTVGSSNTPFPDKPARYWRELEDNNMTGKMDFTLPGEDWRGLEWKLKSGVFASRTVRDFEERTFSFAGGNDTIANPVTFPYNYLQSPYYVSPQLSVVNGRPRYNFATETNRSLDSFYGNSSYDGEQSIDAIYGMSEVPIIESLRLIGGARMELTDMEVNSSAFQDTNIYSGVINQTDLLPAISLMFTPRKDMNFRLSYSQTIARPTFRELAPYRGFDPTGDEIVQGNPNLQMSSIENFDLRWEWFTKLGGLLSVGGFYKLLTDPIEKYAADFGPDGEPNFTGGGNFVTFLNTEEATVWGVELEARQNLAVFDPHLKPLSVGLNFAYIFSEVPLEKEIQDLKFATTGKRFTTRPLYDQSPYILNADLSYDNEETGTSVTVAFYYAAERLSLIVNNAYDVYEQPAPQLDLVISQRLSKHFKLKFSAENLLNPEVMRTYAVDGSTDKNYIYSSYTRGITFGLSLGYTY